MRTVYFTCHCICIGSRFELFHPQPLKYSVSTATHLAHIVLLLFFYETCNPHSPVLTLYQHQLYTGLPEHCNIFVFTWIQSNGFPTIFFLRVCGTLFLCADTVEEVRGRAQLRGNSVYILYMPYTTCHIFTFTFMHLADAFIQSDLYTYIHTYMHMYIYAS